MIGIDMKMPKSCRRCKLKAIEEDMCGDFFYYCPLISKAIRGKDKDKKHEDCPLKEVKDNKAELEKIAKEMEEAKTEDRVFEIIYEHISELKGENK